MSPCSNPVGTLHHALAHAAYEAFSEIQYEDRDWAKFRKTGEDVRIQKTRRPTEYDMTVMAMFPQTWSSTALGFGGIGGQAITSDYVVVIECGNEYAVYFGGRHAYTITDPSAKFFEDTAGHRMADVSGAHKRYKKEAA